MAEEQKTQQEVELDTDGINEEIINVDKPAEPDEAFSKKENVDLGYTDHGDKRTYKKEKDHGLDISFENEVKYE